MSDCKIIHGDCLSREGVCYRIDRYLIDDEWETVATVERPMQLRPHYRRLLRQGYDRDCSIFIEREEVTQ